MLASAPSFETIVPKLWALVTDDVFWTYASPGNTMSDEDGNGSILYLQENHRADFEGKDDNVFVNKWLDDNRSNHQN
ncbi:MAG: hypothetical protein QGG64_09590, partial [Candidatus Latescibacteria bacterium]|nr:hypothetical protein [Candidatus Latescibacterota bacterium]